MSFSIDKNAMIRASDVNVTINGFSIRVNGQTVSSTLVGRFNVYNFLSAYAALSALGVNTDTLTDVCPNLIPAPGRFEQLHSPKGWTAIIDYAHTPDALENCLQTIHDTLPLHRTNAIITVFGAGGDRDKTKRPKMGAIAERLSDMIIVTSDNPRTENARAIIDDILAGINDPDKAIVQPDRAAAIKEGIMRAKSNDVILIAGKGHEDYQVVGTVKHHFSDKEEVLKYFN